MTKRSGSSRRKKAKERAATAAAAAATDYPPWVLFDHYCVKEIDESSSSIADMNTLATGRTSTGNPISVALCVAPPPEPSRVCVQVQLPHGVSLNSSTVLAAHGDSLLIQIASKESLRNETVDPFVYNAGNAASEPPRPPSLSLLPRIPHPNEEEMKDSYAWKRIGPEPWYLNSDNTGLLRRGEDELVVVELEMGEVTKDTSSLEKAADVVLLRCGEWSTKKLPIIHGGQKRTEWELPSSWTTRMVVPVRDHLLCWSDMMHGIIFYNAFDDNAILRYVPFPIESCYGFRVCVTAGGDTVKLVNIFPRCCCGEEGASRCRNSLHACTIRTWILRMDDLTWVMDGVIDVTEIWALDAYRGLPRVKLIEPVVSFDDPNTITFAVCEAYHVKHGDNTEWLVTVDMQSKSISSIFRYPAGRRYARWSVPMPSIFSDYLNSFPSRNKGSTSSPSEIHMDTAAPPSITIDDSQTENATNSAAQSFCNLSLEPMEQASKEVSLEKKILMALEQIPDLAGDVMLKAYSILIFDDDGRRLRSLLELPMNLRKDWLLIEIQAREACSICSACTKDVQYE